MGPLSHFPCSQRRARRAWLALGCLLLPLAAWAQLSPVTLQLKWRHQFQFAGYYVAQVKGYYREAGLAVNIKEIVPGQNPITEVCSGRAQFGISDSELALARGQGRPVVALATIFQHSPLVLLVRAGGDIRIPKDLEGRRLGLQPWETELLAYLRRQGVDLSKVYTVERDFTPDDLIRGKVDALSGYVTDETYDLEKARIPYFAFTPREGGVDFYGDTLFTSRQELDRHPRQVEAFRQASLKGWNYALEHPEEAIRIIQANYSPRHSYDHLRYEAEHTRALVEPDIIAVGTMLPERWQKIVATYQALGLLAPGPTAWPDFVYQPPEAPRLTPWHEMLFLLTALLALGGLFAALYLRRLQQQMGRQMDALRETEKHLQVSEARFRVAFETLPLAAFAWDSEMRVLEWNHRAEEVFGWRREEALGQDFLSLVVAPEARPTVLGIAATLFDSPVPLYQVNTNLTKDGRIIQCHWSNAVVRGTDAPEGAFAISLAEDVTDRRRIQRALEESERRYRLLVESAPFPVLITRLDNDRVLYINQRAAQLLGQSQEKCIGRPAPSYYKTPADRAWLKAQVQSRSLVTDFEACLINGRGEERWVLISAALSGFDGEEAMIVACNDITRRREADEALRESEARFRFIAERSADIIWEMDSNFVFTYINGADERLRGFPASEVIGHSVEEILTPEAMAQVRQVSAEHQKLRDAGEQTPYLLMELEQKCRDGSTIWTEVHATNIVDTHGRRVGICGVTRDISARKRHEDALQAMNRRLEAQLREINLLQDKLKDQATRDGLTGLYNRRYLDETLEREMARAEREGYPLALVMLDIDHFKNLNDSYGHRAGDEVLRQLGEFLRHHARAGDLPCRYGGEEFLLVLPQLDMAHALERAETWRREFAELVVDFEGDQLQATVSAGVACYPDHGQTPDRLVEAADSALYRAKAEGRNRVMGAPDPAHAD